MFLQPPHPANASLHKLYTIPSQFIYSKIAVYINISNTETCAYTGHEEVMISYVSNAYLFHNILR